MELKWINDHELEYEYNDDITIKCDTGDCSNRFVVFRIFKQGRGLVMYAYVDGEFYVNPKRREYDIDTHNKLHSIGYRDIDKDNDNFILYVKDYHKRNLEEAIPNIKDIMESFRLELLLGY